MVADDRQPDESHEPDLDEADTDEADLDLADLDDAERACRAARIAQIDTSVAHPARV